MGLKPTFKISADGKDISAKINERLTSLRVSDAAGFESDTLEITVSADGLEFPVTGAEIRAAIGYDNKNVDVGSYIVDAIDYSYPANVMTIRAKAAQQAENKAATQMLQTQKTRSFDALTIGDLVKTLAADHGLTAAVDQQFASVKLPHIDQINESDMHLLTRIAKEYDAIAKPANGKLLFVKRAQSQSVTGKKLKTFTLRPEQVTSVSLSISKRDNAGTVIAEWQDLNSAKVNEYSAGDGEPVVRLRKIYSDRAQAVAAADADYKQRQRSAEKLTLQLPGDATITAESKISLVGFPAKISRDWVAVKVDHSVSVAGFVTSVTCELSSA